MILVHRKNLFFVLAILIMVVVPFLYPAISPISGGSDDEVLSVSQNAYFVLAEILVYIIVGIITGAASGFGNLVLAALLLSFGRFVTCFFAGSIMASFMTVSHPYAVLELWMGNGLSVILQIIMMLFVGVHLLYFFTPRILSEEAIRKICPEDIQIAEKPARFQTEGVPLGGFVKVYNLQELGRLISNVIGLEGYILYTSEGLVLWKELQLRFDEDKLVVLFQQEFDRIRTSQKEVGFGNPENIITQTKEHNFLHCRLSEKVLGIFIFKKESDIGAISERLQYITKSACDYFETRYQGF